MWEVLDSLVVEVVGGVVLALILYFGRRYTERRPFLELLGMETKEEVLFVLPTRADDPGNPRMFPNTGIAIEDMFAFHFAEGAVALAGVSVDRMLVRPAGQFGVADQADERKNLILICGPKSNPCR
jgi:hypothetical protein